jgi:hypothetical protein
MKEISAMDGCADVNCPNHGFLARVIAGAEVLCKGCRRWIRAVADNERRKLERRRARNQRYYRNGLSSTIQTDQQITV